LARDPQAAAPPDSGAGTSPPDFERDLAELEALVARLEGGDLPLDEALRTFERGVALTRQCQASLKAAQQKVEILLKRGATTRIEPFTASEDDSPGTTRPTED
jgi:exodeoxyribonuclease VII small subunit